jgi:hypothetical protein
VSDGANGSTRLNSVLTRSDFGDLVDGREESESGIIDRQTGREEQEAMG